MLITTLKRFEFSAAWRRGAALTGANFSLWAGVAGPLQPVTGMVVNVSDLKALGNAVLDGYDHRNLSAESALPEPALQSLAGALWDDLAQAVKPPLALAVVELQEEGGPAAHLSPHARRSVTYGDFAAAHRTHAPRLSDDENRALYGICNNPAGHGHNYRAALYLPPGEDAPPRLWDEFDHVNLSVDIPDLRGRNVVTETIAELIARRAPRADRVRVWEWPDFFAEHRRSGGYALGRRYRFNAAHRLHSPALSADENARVYGKCNRPEPHGHTYFVEVVVASARLDPRTETAFDLAELDREAQAVLGPLHNRYLEVETPAFRERPSTGENIARVVGEALANRLGDALETVTIWETPNNQFRARPDGEPKDGR